jgi:hypothetical protein
MTLHWKRTLCAALPVAGLLCTAPLVRAYDDDYSGRSDRGERYNNEERYDREDNYGRAQSAAPSRMSERDLRSFERYLDTHDETAQILYQNPDLINNRRFIRQHEALQDWLTHHPDAAEAVQANPDRYLWRERSTSASDFLQNLLGSHR